MTLTTIGDLITDDLVQVQLNIPFSSTLVKGNLTAHQIAEKISKNIQVPNNWRVSGYGSSGLCQGIFITIIKNVEITRIHEKTKIFIYRNNKYEVFK